MKPMRRRQKGFTLIELMVVIAIITVLAAILLPTLEKSLRLTRQITCSNNLEQQANAMFLYVGDYQDIFPALGEPGAAEDKYCQFRYGGGTAGDPADNRPLYPYIPSINLTRKYTYNSVFWCPEDTIGTIPGWSTATAYYCLGTSYWYNNCCLACAKRLYCGSGRPTGLSGRRVSAITSPSRKAMINEHGIDSMFNGMKTWHVVFGCNMVFVDGHIAPLKYSSLAGFSWHAGVAGIFDF